MHVEVHTGLKMKWQKKKGRHKGFLAQTISQSSVSAEPQMNRIQICYVCFRFLFGQNGTIKLENQNNSVGQESLV